MDRIELKSFAKINLTLDVKGTLPGGMHEVEMVMQQILLCDDVSITWEPAAGGLGQTDRNRRAGDKPDHKPEVSADGRAKSGL